MTDFLSFVLIGVIGLVATAILTLLFVKKRKNETPVQSDIVNDTSYNIDQVEAHKGTEPDLNVTEVEGYLEERKEGGAPLNRKDFYDYKKQLNQ